MDVRDYNSLKKVVDVDVIFHLAANANVLHSIENPEYDFTTNVLGTYNILKMCLESDVKKIIYTSSAAVCGEPRYLPIDEKHPLVGQSPYSASKISADQLAISYMRSFNLPVKIIRPFNTYGSRQSARALIPSIIIQISAEDDPDEPAFRIRALYRHAGGGDCISGAFVSGASVSRQDAFDVSGNLLRDGPDGGFKSVRAG